ncbi:MAG TPA: hypothetical protein PLZ12_03355 [Saprospiraceae bacterium]|nr:hypothetical protein [Saprospiraceae bacterium]
MVKLKFILPILLLFSLSLKAQKKNTIALSYGVNSGLLKDLNFSPLHYKESGHLFSVQYLRHNPRRKNIFEVAVDFSSGKIKTDASTFLTSNFIYGKINASYYRKIKTSESNKYNFYAGAGYTTNLLYFEWDDNEAFSYWATHGLVLNFKANYLINKRNQIFSTISIPFLQLLARPPYNGRNEFIIENQNSPAKIFFNGKLATFNKCYGFSWITKYNFNVNKFIDLSVNYNLNLQKVTGANKLIHLQNQVQTGLNFKF